MCEGDIYDCLSSPCQNDGTCVERVDGITGFQCRCPEPYIGHFCEIDSRGCGPEPCKNGGTCFPQGTTGGCIHSRL